MSRYTENNAHIVFVVAVQSLELYYSSLKSYLFKLLIINSPLEKAQKVYIFYPSILLICIANCHGNKGFCFLLLDVKMYIISQK